MLAAAVAGAAESAPTAAEVEASLPSFEVLSVLGQGGMGVVFKARQKTLDRVVALKVLPRGAAATPGFAERFAREARALAKLQHANIVAVHDFGEADGLFWLVMEFVDGANLRQAMRAGQVAPKDALAIVPQICDALQYAHEHGIVHRDIKPENVLLDKAGRVKVADFGLAKLIEGGDVDRTLTGADQVMGTPHYMAPEQIEHPADVDHRADIYSLGVVFYEMLTGELPLGRFPAPSVKSGIDARIDEIVMRTLAKEREARYQQAVQVKTDMGRAATKRPRREPPKRWREFLPLSPADQAKADRVREAVVGGFLLLLGLNAWISSQQPLPLLVLPLVALTLIAVAAFWRPLRATDQAAVAQAWRRRRRTTYAVAAVAVIAGVVWASLAPDAVCSGRACESAFGLGFWALVFVLGLVRRWNMTFVLIVLLLAAFVCALLINLSRPKDSPLLSPGAAARLAPGAFRAEDDNGFAIEIPAAERARMDELWRKVQALPASPNVEDVAELYPSDDLARIRAMKADELHREAAAGQCGVPLLPRDVLTRPLSDFHLDSVEFLDRDPNCTPQTALGRATAGGVTIRFYFQRPGELGGPGTRTGYVYGPWSFAAWAAVDK
jgi:predicted Ser/Thr protein kinase